MNEYLGHSILTDKGEIHLFNNNGNRTIITKEDLEIINKLNLQG